MSPKPGRNSVRTIFEPEVPQVVETEITDEVLAKIPERYRAGLLGMTADAPRHLGISDARVATAVNDAVSLLQRLGPWLEQKEIPAETLFRIRPVPRAVGDYLAARKLAYGDDVGAQLPVACANCGLAWRLNGGEVVNTYDTHVMIERPGWRVRFDFNPSTI
jgi:hypothetical protein